MSHKAQIILQGATGVLIVAIACIIHAVQPWPNEAQASGRDAMTVNIIDAATLRAMLDRDDVVLIDNRPKEKFSGLGHIPG
ncbi:MAG: rhodanese-like domain-containing protein, partial [Desulfovibrionaceae bacterium]